MKLNVLVLLASLLASVSCYDCYDQKCGGSGQYSDTYISCDQIVNTCTTNYYGYPECEYSSYGGNGVFCSSDNFHCSHYSYNGAAYCSYYDNYDYVYPIVGCSILVFIITACCVFCCRRRRRRTAQQTVIITQTTTTPQVRPVIQNINVTAPPRNYGAVPPNQAGYPGQRGGYPGQQSGYPGQQCGYAGQQNGYPGQQSGYPGQQSGYPGQQGGYPGQQGGYAGQQGGYPGQQGGYPGQQGGYQHEGKFAEQPPPYDANAPPAPPTNEYSTNPNFKGP